MAAGRRVVVADRRRHLRRAAAQPRPPRGRGLAPAPDIGLNAEDAERLEVREGDLLELWLPWMDARAPFALVPSLVTGTAGVPVGHPGLPYISLPARARVAKAEEQ